MVQAKSFEQIFALAKESTWGTGVNPTVVVPATGGSIVAQLSAFYDEGRRGVAAADFGAYIEAGSGEASVEGLAYPDRIGHLLLAICGSDTVTGAGDPYTHTFKAATTPPSYTLEDQVISGSNGGVRITGAMLTALNFSFDAKSGVITYTSSWLGKIPSKVTAQNPALGTVLSAWQGWLATVTSTGFSCKVKSGTINLTRENDIVHTLCNQKDPYAVNVGPLRVEGTLDLVLEDLGDFDRYLANTQQSMVIDFQQSGSPARGIKFTMTNASFIGTPWEVDRGAIGVISKVGFRGLYNTTDAGPAQVELKTSAATY